EDAGRLAGLGRDLGVTATGDADALLALRRDCVVYTSLADVRLMQAIDDLCRILRAGVNVVSSSAVFLQFPDGVVPPEMSDPVREAAAEGGASIFVIGIGPGFAHDVLPLAGTGISERIDQVRRLESLHYPTHDHATGPVGIMGLAGPTAHAPTAL